ncbi:MAG: hypothetical protein RR420_01190 [Anaerovoracaceae bacterium]
MSVTLLRALSEGSYDLKSKPSFGSEFAKKVDFFRDSIVSEYMKSKINLNEAIAKLAKMHNLNADQIKRVIEEVNNQVYLVKYNEMKTSSDRDVAFDIASFPEVNRIISGIPKNTPASNSTQPEKVAYEGNEFIEKVASINLDDIKESEGIVNSFMNTDNLTRLSVTTKSANEIMANQLSEEKMKADAMVDKIASLVAEDIEKIAEAFVSMQIKGMDIQDNFDSMCRAIDANADFKVMIKSACEHKSQTMFDSKETKILHKVALDLSGKPEEQDFSLGKYSMIKTASERFKNWNINVGKNDFIKDLGDLVKRAQSVQEGIECIAQCKARSEHVDEKIASFCNIDDISKEAGFSAGMKAFGNALVGNNKKAANKSLDAAKQTLDSVRFNNRNVRKENVNNMLGARKMRSTAPDGVINNMKISNDHKAQSSRIKRENGELIADLENKNSISRIFDPRNRQYKSVMSEISAHDKKSMNAMNSANKEKAIHAKNVKIKERSALNNTQLSNEESGIFNARKGYINAKKNVDKANKATNLARGITAGAIAVPAALGYDAYKKNQEQSTRGQYQY